MSQQHRSWTDKQIKYLKNNYGKKPLEEMSRYLGKSQSAIRNFASREGIKSKSKWSDRALKTLMREYGESNIDEIASKLGRTNHSIRNKVNRLGIPIMKEASGYLTVTEVSQIIGKSKESVRHQMIHRDGLKAKYVKPYYLIDLDDLYDWMEKHPDKWTPSKCDEDYFFDKPWFNEAHRKELSVRWQEFS